MTEDTRSMINDKVEKLSVPPGFVSLSSFTLKNLSSNEVACSSMAVGDAFQTELSPVGFTPTMDNIAMFKSNLSHRPWILYNQFDYKSNESDSELEMNFPLRACLPKGVVRGCSSCPNCQKVTARWHPEESHRPVLEEAPVFQPSEEEFKESLEYVARIRQKAEQFGICRIVPPPSWKPPCLLKERNIWETSKFKTHIQLVSDLQDQGIKRNLDRSHKEAKIKRRRVWMRSSGDGSLNEISTDANEVQSEAESFISKLGPELTLEAFNRYADDFKRQYFCKRENAINSDANLTVHEDGWEPSVENVEGEYWRIIENPIEEIEVLCCANVETGGFGSGFPVHSNSMGLPNYPEYCDSCWNLNNIFKLPGSLLGYENRQTSAALLPHLSSGMCFSSVCWKAEEHHLYSLSYIHFGSPKIWYVIPGGYCYRFERVVKKHLPHCLEHPELLYKNISQLSPSTLTAEGIPVYRCVQYPGEFVVTFPAAYHSQFDCGFNCSETVNFAPFDWLPFGQHVVEMYCEQGRKTLISHDKLLLGAAMDAVREKWKCELLKKNASVCGKDGILTKALKLRVKQEAIRREYLCRGLQLQKMEDDFDSDKRDCSTCLYDLHFSAIGCSCSPGRYACLLHAKNLCPCHWTARYLLYRYEISELNLLVQALEGRLDAIYHWGKKKLDLRVSSDDLRELRNRGEVSASVKSAATSTLSQLLGPKELVTGQVCRKEEEEKYDLQKISAGSGSRQDTQECIDPNFGNITSKKGKFDKSQTVQNEVIVLTDDED
ncbi:putative lysine-specific demethylase JMJ16 isoform X1 [Coffea arabica]|uniref:Lysine-specific demethylase JMJ16 n=1 Tax=Coffea arabica TaxID=13443 RepID=A0A6P6UX37_COFAR|nr:putative lysine-specific demethylase JMJ16 [Coffea arabica]XP_027094948.1 putative lysine-specific demethylase JMJ16 [Coffea arabica]XP_027094954.1 putative lysine-specific demethylase JMJ16 [Coffea arabica]XP_027094960.1 putative lysine-specific demethylase JMJ16 [Coffea arabica]XP_027094967.1 putative lysine-specific demethylase JMJ16 [Coffea arabica]